MTRSPLAAAAAAALLAGAACAPAFAQSSVTLFGVVDVNVGWIKNDESSWQLGTNGMATGRLGFRGIEDLGGGLRAGFWLEGEINPDTGTSTASYGNGDAAIGGFNFRRRSTVSLFNPWGEIRLGRDNTPTHWNWAVFDPFGTTGVGNAQNIAIDRQLTQGTGGVYGTLVRANNMASYVLPGGTAGSGLVGQLSVAAGEDAPGNKYAGGRIGYSAGPYNVAAAYAETWLTADNSVKAKVWNIGGWWDFGVVRVSGIYNQIDISGGGFPGSQQDNWFIGATAPLDLWRFNISWGDARGGGTISSNNATQFAISANYELSVRTALYAIYSTINNSGNAGYRVTNASSPLTPGHNSQGVQIGVRHIF
ncbi:MAG: porin [Rubrivivax sp.]|nr:porin [Rubrivivax sp.]